MGDFSHIDAAADLRSVFGFPEFRPGQQEALETLFAKRRVLCIQPTGHGKSLLYQLPACRMDGLTLVISPLLALMRDQIDQLNNRFHIPAATINTDQSDAENDEARRRAKAGELRILFAAPEKLENLDDYAFLTALDVAFVVVDEAHCISTWGHDFRPSYRRIAPAVKRFSENRPDLYVLGLTATANRRTETDIAAQLAGAGGTPPVVIRLSMDRPNLRLSVKTVKRTEEKLAALEEILSTASGCGILYCATRDQTETTAAYLSERGLDVVAYHAGFPPEEKRRLQAAFMAGRHKAIAATNALGMGIDKPDVRFIVHVDVPGSITAYYQEVGRAGRDGEPAEGILLFDEADRRIQDHFIRASLPTLDDFRAVYGTVRPDDTGLFPNQRSVMVRTGLHPTRVTIVLAELVEQGLLEKVKLGGRQVYRRTDLRIKPDLSRYENQNAVKTQELTAMLTYGRKEPACYMQALRLALGDVEAAPCGRCGRCTPGRFETMETDDAAARAWLFQRTFPIPASTRPPMSQGVSLLDGEKRLPAFVAFMKNRALPEAERNGGALPEALAPKLKKVLERLKEKRFAGVVVIPSQTWTGRDEIAKIVAATLDAPLFLDLLAWKTQPAGRQGTLLNNDQRRENVAGLMHIARRPPATSGGPLLLLDDYHGSGATMKEAVRALRSALDEKTGDRTDIVPFTIAKVRWRLGAPGMI